MADLLAAHDLNGAHLTKRSDQRVVPTSSDTFLPPAHNRNSHTEIGPCHWMQLSQLCHVLLLRLGIYLGNDATGLLMTGRLPAKQYDD
jgi:hypothetical protein